MTKEQAIEYLKADIKHWQNTSVSTEHLEMAIKSLEQQPSEDCISRQMIIGGIDAIREHHGGILDVRLIATQLPPVTPTQRWIPVSERLPEEIGTYLVTLEYKEHGKGITTLWYHGKQFGWDLRVADVVVAWQPLPQPYEEKKGNKNND